MKKHGSARLAGATERPGSVGDGPDRNDVKYIPAGELDDRQIRGAQLVHEAERKNGVMVPLSTSTSLWHGKGNRAWTVDREERNRRGKLRVEYRCSCGDFQKNGRIDCQHIFAERLRREEVVIDGSISRKRVQSAVGARRPPRKRITASGAPMRSVQRKARAELGERIPELLSDLGRGIDIESGHAFRYDIARALTLVFKICAGKSADEMKSIYPQLIERGALNLRRAPHQNTLSRWMNDPDLTPILEKMLANTAKVFRAMETGAIVDSSKMSQMRSAHARWVDYGDDQRDGADWMKMHALVGLETLACLAVVFSGTRGSGTHDINFILPLVEKVRSSFGLRYVLADKAYLSEAVLGQLWKFGIKAVIPVKKRWEGTKMREFYQVFRDHVEWYDERQAEFHEIYRVRPKIEAFFSLIKRVATDYCWSRGRPWKDVDGKTRYGGGNTERPCTAWKNETLCKVIYVNVRLIVQYEIATGYRMNFLADSFFPGIPTEERLVA